MTEKNSPRIEDLQVCLNCYFWQPLAGKPDLGVCNAVSAHARLHRANDPYIEGEGELVTPKEFWCASFIDCAPHEEEPPLDNEANLLHIHGAYD